MRYLLLILISLAIANAITVRVGPNFNVKNVCWNNVVRPCVNCQTLNTQAPTPATTTTEPTTLGTSTSPDTGAQIGTPEEDSSSTIYIIIGAVVGAVCCICLIVIIVIVLRRRRGQSPPKQSKLNNELELDAGSHYRPVPASQQSASPNVAAPTYGSTSLSINTGNQFASTNRPSSSVVGATLIDYNALKIESTVGEGAYGVVYLGRWRNTRVAIKKPFKASAAEMKTFVSEAEILARLKPHPNVVLFMGVCEDPFCIVTEFVEGGSLDKYLEKNKDRIRDSQRLTWMKGIAAGMFHLHLENIIHRDLAARNILLTPNMEPKISDFGLSRTDNVTLGTGSNSTKTDTGPLKWMSPEAINDKVFSWASDVWSYGVLVWEIYECREPYDGLDPVQTATRVVFQGFTLPPPVNGSPAIAQLMSNCFAREPGQRPTFEAVGQYLDQVQPMD